MFNGQSGSLKHPWRRRVLFACFVTVKTLVRFLPMALVQFLGRLLGYAAYVTLARHRALARANVRRALGSGVSERTCRDVARGSFVSMGKTALEWFVIDRWTPETVRNTVEVRGLAHLQDALADRRGVIALSAHFGNWEVLAMAMTAAGLRGSVVARRLRYPEYEQFLRTLRQRHGVGTLTRGFVMEAVRLLKSNQVLGVVPDQDVDSLDGVFVEFFNQPTYTPTGPAALALMTGAALVPCFVVRSGRRFRVIVEPPVDIARTDDRAQDLATITQRWSRVVEGYIRAYPDQWAWMHPRWKTQPVVDQMPLMPIPPPAAAPSPSDRLRAPSPVSFTAVTVALALMALGGCSKPAAPKQAAVERAAPASGILPAAPVAAPAAAPAYDPAMNQQLDTFSMAGYASDGAKQWDLSGRDAVVDNGFVTVQQPVAKSYGLPDDLDVQTTMPRQGNMNASLAVVEQATRRVRMEHEVSLHTSDGLWLFSPLLYWIPDTSRLTTEQAVRLETDHMLLRGYGATGHTQLKHAVIERDITMVLNPSDQDAPGGNSHVQITCDGPLEFDYEHNVATFKENVHVKDDQGDLYSDTLIAHLDRATRTIRYAEAIGHVRILQQGNTATGERAIYQPAMGKVTLLGAPSLLIEDAQQGGGLSLPGMSPAGGSVMPLPGSPVAAAPGGETEAMAHALGAREGSSNVVAGGAN